MRHADAGSMHGRREWRPGLRRKLAALLIVKVIALAVLWALFFSPPHRAKVNEPMLDRQFSLDSTEPRSGASP